MNLLKNRFILALIIILLLFLIIWMSINMDRRTITETLEDFTLSETRANSEKTYYIEFHFNGKKFKESISKSEYDLFKKVNPTVIYYYDRLGEIVIKGIGIQYNLASQAGILGNSISE